MRLRCGSPTPTLEIRIGGATRRYSTIALSLHVAASSNQSGERYWCHFGSREWAAVWLAGAMAHVAPMPYSAGSESWLASSSAGLAVPWWQPITTARNMDSGIDVGFNNRPASNPTPVEVVTPILMLATAYGWLQPVSTEASDQGYYGGLCGSASTKAAAFTCTWAQATGVQKSPRRHMAQGYAGDSLIGYKGHFGCQALTANLGLFGNQLSVSLPGEEASHARPVRVRLGRRKVGAILGATRLCSARLLVSDRSSDFPGAKNRDLHVSRPEPCSGYGSCQSELIIVSPIPALRLVSTTTLLGQDCGQTFQAMDPALDRAAAVHAVAFALSGAQEAPAGWATPLARSLGDAAVWVRQAACEGAVMLAEELKPSAFATEGFLLLLQALGALFPREPQPDLLEKAALAAAAIAQELSSDEAASILSSVAPALFEALTKVSRGTLTAAASAAAATDVGSEP
ncbi:hypothetical protein AK812_SmicGene5635 [Symbiodinium microadriaticum]|uniref:Uncharacterized protein n=1 Tax=Symbiodinium microadriaticum TaxID=2951 RepID=A0A1Q9ETA0_SYMMI|nr:hypothetical protein AK812_SmicGene5635 [Symbiodinium microadriaticum]